MLGISDCLLRLTKADGIIGGGGVALGVGKCVRICLVWVWEFLQTSFAGQIPSSPVALCPNCHAINTYLSSFSPLFDSSTNFFVCSIPVIGIFSDLRRPICTKTDA